MGRGATIFIECLVGRCFELSGTAGRALLLGERGSTVGLGGNWAYICMYVCMFVEISIEKVWWDGVLVGCHSVGVEGAQQGKDGWEVSFWEDGCNLTAVILMG